jgi:hypothetical protein
VGDGRGSDCRPNCSVYQAVSASTHTGRDISSEDEVRRSGSSYLGPARGGARYVAYGRDNSAAGYLGGGRHVLDLARELEVERVISPQAAPLSPRIYSLSCAASATHDTPNQTSPPAANHAGRGFTRLLAGRPGLRRWKRQSTRQAAARSRARRCGAPPAASEYHTSRRGSWEAGNARTTTLEPHQPRWKPTRLIAIES